MTIKILQDIAVSPNFAAGSPDVTCAYPTPSRLQNGDILCAYRQGREKHSRDGLLMLQRSTDDGVSWSEPVVVHNGLKAPSPESLHTGALCQLPEGTVLAVFTTVEAVKPDVYVFSDEGRKLRRGFYVARSSDGGMTWSPAEPRSIIGAPRLVCVGARPFLLPRGELFIPLEATGEQRQQMVLATISPDGGKTFPSVITCVADFTGAVSHGDPRCTVLPDGRIVMLVWTFLNQAEETVPVRRLISSDGGRSWSAPESTQVDCQIMTPLALNSRHVIAVGNVRKPPEGIRLWVSNDAGKTWSIDSVIQMWDARGGKMEGSPLEIKQESGTHAPEHIWKSLPGFTFGTPDLLSLENNIYLLTYYAVLNGITHIRACRFYFEPDARD